MEQMTVILFICIALPLIPMLFILNEKRSRLLTGYLLPGMIVCLLAGEVNALLLKLFDGDMRYVTTTITPISEEILKAIPVLYFAVFFPTTEKRSCPFPLPWVLDLRYWKMR